MYRYNNTLLSSRFLFRRYLNLNKKKKNNRKRLPPENILNYFSVQFIERPTILSGGEN